jgi:hypothetical protein
MHCHHISGTRLVEGESNGGGRGIPAVVVVLFLQGRPGRHMTVDVGCGVCGAPVGVTATALAMAAWTSGRHLMRFRAPGWRPFGFGRLMLKVGTSSNN